VTISVGSSTPPGTYPIIVTGNGGGIQQSTTLTLIVSGPIFTISASPAFLTVAQGHQGTSIITTAVSGGFSSAIALSASGMPSGTTVSFNPSTIPAPGGGNSTMTISVGTGTAVGTYPITVTGNGGGIQKTTTLTLTVTTTTQHSVALSWNASTFQVVGYNIYRSISSAGPFNIINPSLIPLTSYTDPAVQSGVRYYYYATAVDAQHDESIPSNLAVATVP
jgi:hypothetical protein